MSLKYIMGKSGSGKTTYCIKDISKRDNMKERLFYIVPEQFTLESEKNLLSKKESLININVLGFRHFAYYLISKLGTSGRAILDDVGRMMLIKKIVLELKDKLEFYKNAVDKEGFIDNLDTTITEFMQYGASLEKINLLISNYKEGNLKNKLKDIYLIFSKYREYMAKEYIAGDGALEILCEFIPQSIVRGSEVWIDGFKSYTPQELKVIEQLLKHCKRVNITFTINNGAVEYKKLNSFDEEYEIKKAINSITRLARENSIDIEEVTLLNENYRKYSEEIEFLKNNYFKYKFEPYTKSVNNINIYKANNMYQEIEKVCADIKTMVQYKHYKYSDIALIIGDSSYEKTLSIALNKYDIPNFLDSRRNVATHPLITFITSAINIIAYNWDNKAIFKFLKTGYTDIDFQSIYELENYVIANGIDKYKWNLEWKYGFREVNENSDKPLKAEIEETRDLFVEILEPLKAYSGGKKGSVRDITEKLFEILENMNIAETIENSFNNAIENNDNVKAIINQEIWGMVIDVIDKMVDILGSESVSLREYSKILNAGLNTATIGIAPPTQDYIIVGDMERTRLPDIKAMFVVGANEGNIPIRMVEKGIFTEDERHIMEDNDIELPPDIIQKTTNGKLSIYLNLIKATDFLTISYPTGSINSESLKASSIIAKIKALFPAIKEKHINNESFDVDNVLTGKKSAFDKLIQAVSVGDTTEFIKELYLYYENDEEYNNKLNNIKQGVLSQIPQSYIDEKLLPILWEQVLSTGSISKFERFTSCPFKFFMEYILRAKDKEVYRLKINDVGTLAHRVMEEFSKHISKNKMDWELADRKYTDDFVTKHIKEFVDEMNTDIFENNRNSVILNKITKAAKVSLWANVEQIKASEFKPESFEISFGRNNSEIPAIEIEVEDNKILRLNGVIDRVDKMLKEDKSVYVKIVDYKSSNKSLDINKIYNGLQLQLVLYMNTLIENKNVNPAGMFYFELNEAKIIDVEKNNNVLEPEDAMLNRLAVNGMYDEKLSEELNSASYESTKGRSKEVVKILRDISDKGSESLSEDSMKALLKFSGMAVRDIGSEMSKGNIEISPYKYGDEVSCAFCPYGKVCDFENSDKENLREIKKNNDKAWEEIYKRVEEDKN